ncbi:MAG: glutathione S-transferase N-terminal domain-containing protein [Armatimonadetes bacterium]|nr:glutathione S-transferase N-terminal domain-containing protein [Armatimonadota bacterium]
MAAKTVSVYTTPTCPYCTQVKEYLKSKNVQFSEYNVVTDLEARNEMVRKSGQLGVPVIEVDGQIVIGFNRNKLDELLG